MRRVARLTALVVGALAAGGGCNAVFGLGDVDFGGAGGAATSSASGTSTTSSASDSATSTGATSTSATSTSEASGGSGGDGGGGDGGSGGGGAGGVCAETSFVVGGDFEGGAEAFWSEDNTVLTAEVVEGDLALHVVVAPDVYASATYDFNGEALCTGGCVRSSFSILTATALSFGLGMQDDEAPFGLALIDTRLLAADPAFQAIETAPCIIPEELVVPERVSFVFDDGGDLYIDDVQLIVDDCPAEAVACDTFGG